MPAIVASIRFTSSFCSESRKLSATAFAIAAACSRS
jgi:hypothetical protein